MLRRWLDIPPTWLGLGLLATFGLDRLVPGLATGMVWLERLWQLLILGGVASMGLAVLEFLRGKTSFIPRRVPSAFLKQGIYKITRNPIYLGDAMVLGGAALALDVLPALLLVPVFMGVIKARFISGEEAGLIAKFGDEAREYFARVRRWM